MKKFLVLILVTFLLLSFASCKSSDGIKKTENGVILSGNVDGIGGTETSGWLVLSYKDYEYNVIFHEDTEVVWENEDDRDMVCGGYERHILGDLVSGLEVRIDGEEIIKYTGKINYDGYFKAEKSKREFLPC